MIRSLRKRHWQIWILLALLLPAGIVAAWLVVPGPATGKLLQPFAPAALPLVWKEVKKDGYTVRLRSNADSSVLQLEWVNAAPLVVPSAIVYQGTDVIGRIGEKGTYRFLLTGVGVGKRLHFILYDNIHHRLIDNINFQP